MCDMFTILLVFLLQSYSTAEVQLTPDEGMNLPLSSTQSNPVMGVKVSLSKNQLRLNERTIASLQSEKFKAEDIESSDQQFIKPLFAELQKINEEQKDKEKKITQVLLQADADLPYDMVRKVFYTASMAGFPQMKMITLVGN